jgi:hypothetical protein
VAFVLATAGAEGGGDEVVPVGSREMATFSVGSTAARSQLAWWKRWSFSGEILDVAWLERATTTDTSQTYL